MDTPAGLVDKKAEQLDTPTGLADTPAAAVEWGTAEGTAAAVPWAEPCCCALGSEPWAFHSGLCQC